MGPTLVTYLRGAGARATRSIEVTTAQAITSMAGSLWLATEVVVGAAVAAVVGVGSRLGLDPPAGGGEEWCTRGLKLCPPCVFTMLGPEKEKRWGSGGRRI